MQENEWSCNRSNYQNKIHRLVQIAPTLYNNFSVQDFSQQQLLGTFNIQVIDNALNHISDRVVIFNQSDNGCHTGIWATGELNNTHNYCRKYLHFLVYSG